MHLNACLVHASHTLHQSAGHRRYSAGGGNFKVAGAALFRSGKTTGSRGLHCSQQSMLMINIYAAERTLILNWTSCSIGWISDWCFRRVSLLSYQRCCRDKLNYIECTRVTDCYQARPVARECGNHECMSFTGFLISEGEGLTETCISIHFHAGDHWWPATAGYRREQCTDHTGKLSCGEGHPERRRCGEACAEVERYSEQDKEEVSMSDHPPATEACVYKKNCNSVT